MDFKLTRLMKATYAAVPLLIAVLLTASCKHEIPEPPGGGGGNPPPSSICSPDTVYFQQQVLPLLVSNCAMSGCHDVATHEEGVILTDYNSIMNTGDVRPYYPNNSEIYEKIMDNDDDDRMPPPPRSPLTTQQKETIRKWIAQGAKNNSCISASCDTANITFQLSVQPIVQAKCQGCHSSSAPQGGIDLSTYAGVKAKVTDGRLWGAINHLAGFSPMPKNGNKLSDCEIATFRKWIEGGAPNN
jgi:hypothetical protein